MPLDGLCLTALRQELGPVIIGSRVDKIHQPAKDEVILSLRNREGALRLLLTAGPTRSRAQILTAARENPAQAPMFCMLLRKHLSGGRLVSLEQPPLERLLRFDFEVRNELGDLGRKSLVLEAMGRHANLLLLDDEDRILDCLRKVSQDMSAERQLLPGMYYRLPDGQGKCDPRSLSPAKRAQLLDSAPQDLVAERWLMTHFAGLSPLLARELSLALYGQTDAILGTQAPALLSSLETLLAKLDAGKTLPYLLLREGKPSDFSCLPLLQYGPTSETVQLESFSALFDRFYSARESNERVRQKGQELFRAVNSLRERCERKLSKQRREWQDTQNRELLRQRGDLITANLYRLEKGMERFEAENYYDPELSLLEIRLDPLRSPQQNAARYYKDYQRAKTAERILDEQIKKGETELRYLSSVQDALSRAEGERDLAEIRRELEDGGYLRARTREKQRQKRPVAQQPLSFFSSAGLRILVGRNNNQNDTLTCRLAARSDIWFHVQGIHGAHVILCIEDGTADLQSLEQAASLAAYFSQGRDGGKIPVDYTPVRYVKKPAGAKPGMVIYSQHETAMVSADASLVQTLKR